MSDRPGEETVVHTRILRVQLAVEESYTYWRHVPPGATAGDPSTRAFEERWFGARSQAHVKRLLSDLAARFDRYPEALATLRQWTHMPAAIRPLICHWHLQLADPLYRLFTGRYLLERRETARGTVDRPRVAEWARQQGGGRWSPATAIQFGSKLLSTTLEAGLVAGRRDPRTLTFPRVPNQALAYLLFVLRGVSFEGSLLDNPYLASVGLTGAVLDQRLASFPGLTFRRVGNVTDLEWVAPSFESWSAEVGEAVHP